MIHTLLPLCLALTMASAPDGPVTELRYHGAVEQLARNEAATPTKSFDVYYLLAGQPDHQRAVFLVDERGAGGWAWPERYGQMEFDAAQALVGQRQAQLLHEHDGSTYPLPLLAPLFAQADKLAPDAAWEAGKLSYEVVKSAERAGRPCWQVAVENNTGRWATLWVEKDSGRLVAAEQRVFMGRGDEFRLTMELQSAETVADPQRQKQLAAVTEALLNLQKALERPEGKTEPELTPAQLERAAKAAAPLAGAADGTAFGRLTAVIGRDVKSQQQRTDDVQSLAKKYVGQSAPEWGLTGLDGKPVNPDDHKGKIVVLHFWKYHGEPLNEPYGQVGYLDFLNGRRSKLGVKVYGVAVDPRLGDAATRPAAVRQVRKLQEFFNLSYSLATDDGTLLGRFGDPQRLGAKLPLWVVIGPDGKVAHYSVGHYDIKPDEGLRPLDDVLAALIRQQREADAEMK